MGGPPSSWPRPLRLLAFSISLGPDREGARSRAAELARAMTPEEWRGFPSLVIERHRVVPLLSITPGLAFPDQVLSEIRAAGRQAALEALQQKGETIRLCRLLDLAGVHPILLKGWALAERLYGSTGARQGRDLDFLVRDEEFATACKVLREAGYSAGRCDAGDHLARVPSQWILKDVEFHRPGQAFTVELHARSNAYRGWPSLWALPDGLAEHRIDATGVSIGVPSPRGDLTYLSIHGIQHVFSRLRWLHDIARLLELRSAETLAADLAAAEQISAGSFVRISAGLANSVFGGPWPSCWSPLGPAEGLAMKLILRAIATDDFAGHGRVASLRRVALKALAAGTARQRLSLLGGAGAVLFTGRRE